MIARLQPEIASLIDDLRAEQDTLDAVVAVLKEDEWVTPTSAPGWNVRDQIAHLGIVDEYAYVALTDPLRFADMRAEAIADPNAYAAATAARGRSMTGEECLELWRTARAHCLDMLRNSEAATKVQWFGPPMGVRSFATARLMETWSHGYDVVQAMGGAPVATDRLAHIAHLGVATREWSLAIHGLELDATPVLVDLALPSGVPWRHGLDSAANRIVGSALDFCLVATQRVGWHDTGLIVDGDSARRWMDLAQSFAGPATTVHRSTREG